MKEPPTVTASSLSLGEILLPGEERASARDAVDGLVAAAREGDEAAFEQLYALYGPMVHGILLARVARPQVDDLMRDVFVTAWRRLDGLRDCGAFGGWLAMIARNRATDCHRLDTDERSVAEVPSARSPISRSDRTATSRCRGRVCRSIASRSITAASARSSGRRRPVRRRYAVGRCGPSRLCLFTRSLPRPSHQITRRSRWRTTEFVSASPFRF